MSLIPNEAQQPIQEHQDFTTGQYNSNNNDQGVGQAVTALGSHFATAATTMETTTGNVFDVYDGNPGLDADVVLDIYGHETHKRTPGTYLEDAKANKRIRLMADPTNGSLFPSPLTATPAKKQIHNEQWEIMFERLCAFKALRGHCLVPKRFVEDPKLGTWVETQVRLGFVFCCCSAFVRIKSTHPFFD